MNILVLSVAVDDGDALSIMNNLYEDVKRTSLDYHWYFAVGSVSLNSNKHATVLRFPWAKRSRLLRLYFDRYTTKKLMKKFDIDYVVSLQNTTVSDTEVPQILYLQQSIPFVGRKFKLTDGYRLWEYQNIIAKTIETSLKRSLKTIVQSKWMKTAILDKVSDVRDEDIIVSPPKMTLNNIHINSGKNSTDFFYPAEAFTYKNHNMIVEASKLLKAGSIEHSIDFTINGNENRNIKELRRDGEKLSLPIHYLGTLPHKEVLRRYSTSTLVFASDVETYGLPLLEARLSNAIVLALDTPFAREILDGYTNGYFFTDAQSLHDLMMKVINKDIQILNNKIMRFNHKTLASEIVSIIEDDLESKE